MNTFLLVSIRVKPNKDSVPVAHIFIEIHHALLFAYVIGMAELVHLNDHDMRTEVNEDIRSVTGTSAIDGLVTSHGDRILEVSTECVYNVVFFDAEAAGDGIVRMEDTVTAEAIRFPAG